ncbi:hypothetical protein ACHHYP_00186 [Achlya hypogyna]|uniref:OB domain-containing protein n=1 Tax=Achlya hypogyna TaxID=1202772 RepID=A0A1V9ZB41_ACHHY|nr:hypothetical protein ACHHYP_00186 [Achlya hypogyna]
MDSTDDNGGFSKSNWVVPEGTTVRDDRLSLRYLNEFVGDLKCAPQLLEYGLFPDAKEVTETMGVFNAIRKLGLHVLDDNDTPSNLRNGIVVVGDGMTPRTAAMFANRTKGWTCYSVDPIMRVGTPDVPVPWANLDKVVPICAKIEDIRIRLNKAIVVLVHAHVTIEQAMSAIQANSVVAVLSLPWYLYPATVMQCWLVVIGTAVKNCSARGEGFRISQDLTLNRPPDVVYDDMSILSLHREIRLWLPCHPEPQTIINLSGSCVAKVYSAPKHQVPSAQAFLRQALAQAPVVPSDIVATVVATCQRLLPVSSTFVVLGNQDELCAGLLAAGFATVKQLPELVDDAPPLTTDAIIDVGYLHTVLSRVEKTKASLLVAELCRLYQTWLPAEGGHVLCLSGRRVLRNSKYFNRPSLSWTTSATPLASTLSTYTTFLYHCQTQAATIPPDAPTVGLSTLTMALDDAYGTPDQHSEGTSIAEVLAAGDRPDQWVQTAGVVSRIHTLHAKLTLVDLSDVSGHVLLVLLRQDSLLQPTEALRLPHALLQHLRLGDVLQVRGPLEVTGNGSLSVKATAVRFQSLASRDPLVYYS